MVELFILTILINYSKFILAGQSPQNRKGMKRTFQRHLLMHGYV